MSTHNICFCQEIRKLLILFGRKKSFGPQVVLPVRWFLCLYVSYVCLFVLRFYGPVNPMGSCRAGSVYLTTFTVQA